MLNPIPSLGTYNGGKSGDGVYQTIINHIPPIGEKLIIGCLGHCGILRNIKPAKENYGFDVDPAVILKWIGLDLPYNYIIDQCDILKWIKENPYFFSPGDFLYLDPPYLFDTRKGGNKPLYKFEWNREQHITMLKLVTELRCNIAISCYDNPLYQKHLKGWNKITFVAQTRRGPATETLYFNYPFPTQLHDYSYIGKDYRERENISKKIKRHVSKLQALPVLERNAIIHALNDQVSELPVRTRKVCGNPDCGKIFNPNTARAVYCSDRCRVASHRKQR